MIRVEHSIVIQAPVDRVFSYAADYQKWPEWYAGVSEVKTTTAATKGNKARYAYRVRVMGIPAGVETEIHDYVENSGWTGVGTKGLPHRTTWIFEPVGSATRFTHVVEGHVPVPLLGSLIDSLFLKPQWDRIVETSLGKLNQHFLPTDRDPLHG